MNKPGDIVDKNISFSPWRGLLAMLSALVITACAFAPIDSEADYPPPFPRLAGPVGPCPDVGRLISNRGERYNPASGLLEPAMLDRDVLGLPHLFAGADVLRLTFDESAVPGLFGPMKVNILHLVSDSGQDWRTPPDRSICHDGAFQYVVKDAGAFHPIGFGVSSDTIVFTGAVDGSLIIRQGHQESGLLFVVPYKVRSGTIFYRFPVLTGAATRLP